MNRPRATAVSMDRSSKTVLGLLILAAIVPAACVLWFMAQAMRNERWAVQQRLTDVYTNHLASAQRRIDAFWTERFKAIGSVPGDSPASRFAEIVRTKLADSVIVYDAQGNAGYPGYSVATGSETSLDPAGWNQARELEFQRQDFTSAAMAYEKIATESANPSMKAKALLAQANCLVKAGDRESALSALVGLSNNDSLAGAVTSQGTLILPNAQLRLLKLLNDPTDARYQETLKRLIVRLNDYHGAALVAPQRRFLMEEVEKLVTTHSAASQKKIESVNDRAGESKVTPVGRSVLAEPGDDSSLKGFAARRDGLALPVKPPDSTSVLFPTLDAERLAAAYLETAKTAPSERLTPVPEMSDVWHLRIPDNSVVALYRKQTIQSELTAMLASEFTLADAAIELLPPGQARAQSNPIPASPAGEMLPGWRLAVAFPGLDPFATAHRRQVTTYSWIALFVIGTLAVLTFVVARLLTAQMRLAGLKSDLVSTVSHELRTPLASMRALVDTLLANRVPDAAKTREYLELISKENHRLSHLIENFLTFSRMERGRQRFQFESVAPKTIVDAAIEPLRERLESERCQFTVEIESNLPPVRADPDALTTALINLLDNALKYTGEEKTIRLKASRDSGSVSFMVEDNGVGLSAKERERIFDRFYQVDQSLTRERGGCGLGLSIVQYIVRAHGGTIEVESEPGRGSLFRVRLPCAGASTTAHEDE